MRLVKIIILIFLFNKIGLLRAQPIFNKKQIVNGITIFKDSADAQLFYYEPGELVLSRNDNGEPNFQFLDMRYTGSRCYNDQGDKNFMSLLQFDVEMEQITPQALKDIKKILNRPALQLVPLPISHLETKFVIASIINNNDNKLEKEGALEINGNHGYSSSKTFWLRRTFVVKLNEHESQLLKQRLTSGMLGISLDYTYYSNFTKGKDYEVAGDSELIETLNEKLKDVENSIENKIVRSDAINIAVDVNKYPQTIRQIDLNEQIPPAYANTEIVCYDFTQELRPDLYMKIVEIEAESVDREKTISIETKFTRKHPDIYSKHIAFPFAVYVDTPMRYRITEININGEKKVTLWINKPECSATIDATTPPEDQGLVVKNIEVEINARLFIDDKLDQVVVSFSYVFNQSIRTKELLFDSQNSKLQNVKLVYDKAIPVFYTIKKVNSEHIDIVEPTSLVDDYIYIEF